MKNKRKRQNRSLKDILFELRDSILLEVVWNILMFIPRVIIRLLKDIW